MITKNSILKAGNFLISVGITTSEVAIVSLSSGDFVKLSQRRRSKKLKKVKSTFRAWLNSDETFTFSNFTPEQTTELINILKK